MVFKFEINPKLIDRIIFWKVDNFFDALQPFQYISWVIGFGFIDNDAIRGRKMSSWFWEYIFLVFWLVFYMVFQRINWADNYFLTMSSSPIVNVGRRGMVLFGMNIGSLALISSYLVRGRCTKLFRKILEVDADFKSMGFNMDFKMESFKINLYNLITISFTILLIIISILFVDTCITIKLCVYMHVPLYVMNNLAIFYTNHLTIFTRAIDHRFLFLNKCLM